LAAAKVSLIGLIRDRTTSVPGWAHDPAPGER
jgi:hypothetical protein